MTKHAFVSKKPSAVFCSACGKVRSDEEHERDEKVEAARAADFKARYHR